MSAQYRNTGGNPALIPGSHGVLALELKREVKMNEALETLDGISSVVGYPDGSFVVVSGSIAAVVLYDPEGNQVRRIGSWGEGPFEYVRPSFAQTLGDKLVVLDGKKRKFVVYDGSGRGVEEWRGFTSSLGDFRVSEDKLVTFDEGSHEHFMMALDRSSGDTTRFAPGSLQQSAMLVYASTGRIGLRGDEAYYMYPDEAAVRMYDLRTNRERVVRIEDADWNSDTSVLPRDDYEELNNALQDGRLFTYISQNSVALGVTSAGDYTIAMVEDGELDFTDDPTGVGSLPEERQRVLKLFVFDASMNFLDEVRIPIEMRRKIGETPLGSLGNGLLFVSSASDAKGIDVEWVLRHYEIVRR